MGEPTIRQRSRPDPDAPPPRPSLPGAMRWPNGAEVYVSGGAGKTEQQRGWIIRSDGIYKSYRRTGPGEDDIQFMGSASDLMQALSKLGPKLWSVGYKTPKAPALTLPTSADEPEPSPPSPDARAPRVRERVRQPARA